ncbi:hypothetical protein [Vulcanisaeta sp. JCM 16159]|uniref:hypothetical protein n=1 Tax=Vulcanisaeta sp. JCM 16159 TaxID=1295371 RepID=UPI0006CF47E9|nr:hypothetical protein [Vulcanisaeta sp. JCM 16159]
MFGRSIIYNAIPIIEELIGNKFFYGLDEVRVGGTSLRELFYELPPDEADRLIEQFDNTDRHITIDTLRTIRPTSTQTRRVKERAMEIISNNNPYKGKLIRNISIILRGLVLLRN